MSLKPPRCSSSTPATTRCGCSEVSEAAMPRSWCGCTPVGSSTPTRRRRNADQLGGLSCTARSSTSKTIRPGTNRRQSTARRTPVTVKCALGPGQGCTPSGHAGRNSETLWQVPRTPQRAALWSCEALPGRQEGRLKADYNTDWKIRSGPPERRSVALY